VENTIGRTYEEEIRSDKTLVDKFRPLKALIGDEWEGDPFGE
jgi:hypothetical protein